MLLLALGFVYLPYWFLKLEGYISNLRTQIGPFSYILFSFISSLFNEYITMLENT